MKKTTAAAWAASLLGLAGLLYWLSPGPDGALQGEALPGPAMASSGPANAAPPPAYFTTGTESLPASLEGTEVDGELEVDANGRLKITHGVRRVFDYFLSGVGEEPLETALARIRAYIRHQLPPLAAAEAERLLESYIAYKRGLDAIPQAQPAGNTLDISALQRQLQQVQALRSQFFTPEVITAFFGDEDAYDRYTLARFELMQNKNLSPAQRAQQLAMLEGQLPVEMRESIRVINQVQSLEALTEDWKQRGGSPAELRQIRESLVGPEAADRLETLDRERAGWDSRMDKWYGERAAILGNQNLSQTDRQRQLEELRRSRFSAEELARVASLERMYDRGEITRR